MYLEEEIDRINKILTQLKKKKYIAVWGVAETAVKLFQYTNISKYNIKIIIDNEKYGSAFWGRTVITPSQAAWSDIDAVVVAAFYKEREIVKELKEKYCFAETIITFNQKEQEKPFYQHLLKTELQVPIEYRNIIQENSKFKNIHKGKRCFILCTGPSVNLLDLKKLEGEYSIAASNFYMHKDYDVIKPNYYCVPNLSYNDKFTEEFGRKHLKMIEKRAGDTHFFYSITEKEMIEQYGMYKGKSVNYLFFSLLGCEYEEVDLTLKTLMVQSVPIMCLELAIYMGFSEVYLIGTEHDLLTTGQYKYFYNRNDNVVGNVDISADGNSNITRSYEFFLPCFYRLWEQYRIMKRIAGKKGIKIFNATPGGQLDLFERVDYNTLFN